MRGTGNRSWGCWVFARPRSAELWLGHFDWQLWKIMNCPQLEFKERTIFFPDVLRPSITFLDLRGRVLDVLKATMEALHELMYVFGIPSWRPVQNFSQLSSGLTIVWIKKKAIWAFSRGTINLEKWPNGAEALLKSANIERQNDWMLDLIKQRKGNLFENWFLWSFRRRLT